MNPVPKPVAAATSSRATSEPSSPTPSSTLAVRPSSRAPVDPKKRRVDDDSEVTSPVKFSIRAVSPSGSVRSTLSTVLTTTTDSKAQGSYTPWDRDAFLERLKTFRFVDKWSAKPTAVNEVAWARRGWICFDKNRVRCNTCRAELLVGVELDDEMNEDGRALVERYSSMVVDEHDESCLWRRKGCDGRFSTAEFGHWVKDVLIAMQIPFIGYSYRGCRLRDQRLRRGILRWSRSGMRSHRPSLTLRMLNRRRYITPRNAWNWARSSRLQRCWRCLVGETTTRGFQV